MTSLPPRASSLHSRCGIGLRQPHVAEVLSSRPEISWLEVHAENYLAGGKRPTELDALRRCWEISLHGVGLSLAGPQRPERRHLSRLKALADRISPTLFSEHLAWSYDGNVYFNDLLPVPYTEESLAIVCANVAEAQDFLDREILIENPTRYFAFAESSIPEAEFLTEVTRRTGCGLLCDVNNIYVNSRNLGEEPHAWLRALPVASVREIHLSGHHENDADGERILIDDHGSQVAEAVWELYSLAVRLFPEAMTLIEWDSNIPPLMTLLHEAEKADRQRARTVGGLGHAPI